MKKKKLLECIMALVFAMLLTTAIEFLYFNGHALFGRAYLDQYSYDAQNGYSFAKRETNKSFIYTINTDGKYINKFFMEYKSDLDIKYKILLYQNGSRNEKLGPIKLADQAPAQFQKAVTVVNQKADRIVIKINKKELPNDAEFIVSSFILANQITVNPLRLGFIFVLLFLFFIVLSMRNILAQHLEYTFFLMAVAMGGIIIILVPNVFVSWDEQIHFHNAYAITFHEKVRYTQSAYDMYQLAAPTANTLEERRIQEEYLQEQNRDIVFTESKEMDLVAYNYYAYLPQAFGLKLGRMAGIPFRDMFLLGKFFNLLIYSLVMSAAIKYTFVGKRLIYCIGLLPTSVFLASSFSYDAFVTAFLTFGMVMVLNELMDGKKSFNWKRITAGVLALLLGSFSKAVYIPLLLLLCFLPGEKFSSKKQRYLFIATVVVIFFLMMSSFVLPAVTNLAGNIDAGGDTRGGDTSVTRQLLYIMNDPLNYMGLLLHKLVGFVGLYFLGAGSRTSFAYMGTEGENGYYASLLLTVIVVMADENQMIPDKKLKAILGMAVFSVAALIWTALYLDFTPVGANTINGVQQRYYIPLMYPFLLLFSNNKIKWIGVGGIRANTMMILVNLAVLSICIYKLILLPYCI